MGPELDVIGFGAGTGVSNPEHVLHRHDIVFATARCALEAMAVGAAVVLCDFGGVGPMVTGENFDRLRCMNFGQGALVLREPQVTSEKEVVANERRYRVDDDVEGAVSELLYKTAYTTHAYRWPTIGWMADIEGFTTDDCAETTLRLRPLLLQAAVDRTADLKSSYFLGNHARREFILESCRDEERVPLHTLQVCETHLDL